jgi:hypothetical protein
MGQNYLHSKHSTGNAQTIYFKGNYSCTERPSKQLVTARLENANNIKQFTDNISVNKNVNYIQTF